MNKLTKQHVHARLIERGSNFRQFALQHGHAPRTVRQAVERYVGHDELPRGRQTFLILQQLSQFIGAEIVPGLLPGLAAAEDMVA